MMARAIVAMFVLSVALAGGAYWLWIGNKSDVTFSLLNPEEVSMLATEEPATKPQKKRSLKISNGNGPGIKVAAPSGFALKSPVDFDIRLEPKDGVAVDMTSLRIDYRLGPAWVNLTGRIMKQATVEGSRLIARGAELPAGNHTLRLTAKDANARTTRATVSFSVTK